MLLCSRPGPPEDDPGSPGSQSEVFQSKTSTKWSTVRAAAKIPGALQRFTEKPKRQARFEDQKLQNDIIVLRAKQAKAAADRKVNRRMPKASVPPLGEMQDARAPPAPPATRVNATPDSQRARGSLDEHASTLPKDFWSLIDQRQPGAVDGSGAPPPRQSGFDGEYDIAVTGDPNLHAPHHQPIEGEPAPAPMEERMLDMDQR